MTDPIRDRLTERIIECLLRVHHTLGPGFQETVYHKALLIALRKAGFHAETEREYIVTFEGEEVGRHRLDLLVEGSVILELKTVEALSVAHYAQVRSYLRASGLATALLVNFSKERVDFRRTEQKGLCP